MENLTSRICWELVKKEGYIAIWRKPLNNSCYVNRDAGAKPPLCDLADNPDSVWYFEFLIFGFDLFFYKNYPLDKILGNMISHTLNCFFNIPCMLVMTASENLECNGIVFPVLL